MSCCISSANRVRFIVFTDLVLALSHTIFRVTTLSLALKRVFGVENGLQVNTKAGNVSLEQVTLMKFSTVFLITAAVVGLAFEFFLFFLLSNGARSKNYRHCKHWLIFRLFLLILSIIGSVMEHVRNEYTLINGIMELEKVYRIITLVVVRSFMLEIYKGGMSSDNHYEYTSSVAAEGGYPQNPSFNVPSHIAF